MNQVKRIAFVSAVVLVIAMSAHAQSADISVTKSGPDVSPPDTDVTYMVTITNFGPDDSPNVTLDDPIPPGMTFMSAMQTGGAAVFSCSTPAVGGTGTISCSIASFTAGASADFTFVTHIAPGAGPGTAFTNIATATSSIDPNSENDAGVTTTFTPSSPADMGVTKMGPSRASPGDNVTYSIELINAGPNDATTVTLTDPLPAEMTLVSFMQTSGPTLNCTTPAPGMNGTITCTIATFPAGQTATFTLTTNIALATPPYAELANTASVSSDVDPNVENDVSTASTIVSAVDISVTKSGPPTAVAGTDITYTITISNAGPDVAKFVALTDPLPPATTFVSLTQDSGPAATCSTPAVGSAGTVQCSFLLDVPAATMAQFTLVIRVGDTLSITNTATGTSESSDTNTSNDAASVMTTVTPVADVSIVKTAPAVVPAGSTLTFTLTLTNSGPSTVTAVTLSDAVPAGTTFVSATQTSGPAFLCTTPPAGGTGTVTCTSTTLAPSAVAVFSMTVSVPTLATVGTTITNTATVSAIPDSNAANNSSTTMTTSTQPIPALSPFVLAALAVGLAFAGTVLLRRI